MSVGFRNNYFPLYYTSFNIEIIRNAWPKFTAIEIKDAIDLLTRNEHLTTHPHHSFEEQEHLRADYKELYRRYIATSNGVLAFRSSYYWGDIIFNVVLAKFTLLQATLGAILIWIITSVVNQLKPEGTKKPEPHILNIIIQHQNKPSTKETFDTIRIGESDTTIFLKDSAFESK